MNYIEIIGPQGAGKSTLLNHLVEIRNPEENWRTFDEAVIEIVDAITWKQLNSGYARLYYLLNKCNFINFKKNGISNSFFREQSNEAPFKIQERFEYIVDAQFKALSSESMKLSPINKAYLLNWHMKALGRVFQLEMHDYDKVVLFDEGPVKTHYGLKFLDQNLVDYETLPRAIIYCFLDEDENINRIYNRNKYREGLSRVHNELNDANISVLVNQIHRVFNSNYEVLKKLNIPVLRVNMNEQIDIDEVLEFVNKHVMK